MVMQSVRLDTAFPAEIIELEKMVQGEPDNLIYQIALASALQEAGYFQEAIGFYRQAQALDTDGIYGETIAKALEELAPYDQEKASAPVTPPPTPEVPAYPPEIAALQADVAADPSDLVAQITFAHALEEGGYFADAIKAYETLKERDEERIFHGTCDQAIAHLRDQLGDGDITNTPTVEWRPPISQAAADEALDLERSNLTLRKRWANLPIGAKQFTALMASSALTVVAIVGTGMAIALKSGQVQLKNQTLAELVVTDNNYQVKINQMGFGFRGQSDNVAIIEAAQLDTQQKPIPPALQARVKAILSNEIKSRDIEYASLLGLDQRVIISPNAPRQGQVLDPRRLVTLRRGFPNELRATTVLPKAELIKEAPPNAKLLTQDHALMRFIITPVRDPQTRQIIGTLVAGDMVNGKNPIVEGTLDAFKTGYSAVYYLTPDGKFQLATSVFRPDTRESQQQPTALRRGLPLPSLAILEQARANPNQPVTTRLTLEGEPLTVAVDTIKDVEGNPTAFLVRGTSEQELNRLLERTFLLQMAMGGAALLLSALLAYWLGKALTKPLQNLQSTAQKLGQGETDVRAEVESKDEVGQLAMTFNTMAEQIAASTQALQATSEERQKEAENQRQQKEALQAGVMRLLNDIEESAKGNLTVRSAVEAGAVGAIADAFNATLAGLRKLVKQVVDTAEEVSAQAQQDSTEIIRLSDNALAQAQALESATASVADMALAIESVAESAQTAAAIARQGNTAAQQGQTTMDKTVESIYNIRGRVAEISKKSKRLAESSLEISKIVGIISGISEKTNLLAFNASIEAARAGENGQGFRIVADEVRRLAEMVTLSAQEIEQVILGIQEETAQMSQLMEESTAEVVTGTQLVQQTKETLANLTHISEEIDQLLDSISRSTESQRIASQTVSATVQNVTTVAKATSDKSQQVSQSLQSLAKTAVDLQSAAAQFKVEEASS